MNWIDQSINILVLPFPKNVQKATVEIPLGDIKSPTLHLDIPYV